MGQEGQESSSLLCSGSWKALGQVKLHSSAGISLELHIQGLAGELKKCLPFSHCYTGILIRKQGLLCRALVGSGLQLWQREGGRAQLPLSGSEKVEVSAVNSTSSFLVGHCS